MTDIASARQFDSSLLRTRLADVLEFALEHVQKLSLYASLWTEPEENETIRMEDKILAETAILVLLASRIPDAGAPIAGVMQKLTDLLETRCRDERTWGILLRAPHHAAPLGLVQTILGAQGRGSLEMQNTIRDIFASGLAETIERIP